MNARNSVRSIICCVRRSAHSMDRRTNSTRADTARMAFLRPLDRDSGCAAPRRCDTAMTYSGLSSDRFLGLEGVRALAILAVMVHHLAFLGPEHPAWLLPGGFLGVDVFLVLSGFLITRSITEELRSTNSFSFSRFAARRMWRLLPALLGMMLIHGVVLLFLGDPKSEELLQPLLHVSSVSHWQLSVG